MDLRYMKGQVMTGQLVVADFFLGVIAGLLFVIIVMLREHFNG